MLESRVLRKLREGKPVVGPVFGMLPLARIAEVIGRAGYDFLWVDLESRPVDWQELYDIGIGCRAAGMDLVVRLAKTGEAEVAKVLQLGATGVMVPKVESVEEARRYARWAKYHPEGERGFDNCGPDADFGLADKRDYIAHANRETFCAVWMEDKAIVESIDAVAAVEGVDVLLVGFADLSISYGVPFQKDHPLVTDAVRRMGAAAKKHGKFWGVPFGEYSRVKEFYDMGARVFLSGIDEQDMILEGMTLNCRRFHDAVGSRA
ncbi:MAG: aldolase/citrate lyase family protein [Planctomycetota bacterium]